MALALVDIRVHGVAGSCAAAFAGRGESRAGAVRVRGPPQIAAGAGYNRPAEWRSNPRALGRLEAAAAAYVCLPRTARDAGIGRAGGGDSRMATHRMPGDAR